MVDMCRDNEFNTLLDYGCGKGHLRREILKLTPNIRVSEYDPAIEGKEQSPEPVNVVFCGDVLEHIEPDYLDAVLGDIARCAEKAGVLYIATNEAGKFLPDGRNAHLIQEDMYWWFNKISEFFEIITATEYKLNRLLFMVVPK